MFSAQNVAVSVSQRGQVSSSCCKIRNVCRDTQSGTSSSSSQMGSLSTSAGGSDSSVGPECFTYMMQDQRAAGVHGPFIPHLTSNPTLWFKSDELGGNKSTSAVKPELREGERQQSVAQQQTVSAPFPSQQLKDFKTTEIR